MNKCVSNQNRNVPVFAYHQDIYHFIAFLDQVLTHCLTKFLVIDSVILLTTSKKFQVVIVQRRMHHPQNTMCQYVHHDQRGILTRATFPQVLSLSCLCSAKFRSSHRSVLMRNGFERWTDIFCFISANFKRQRGISDGFKEQLVNGSKKFKERSFAMKQMLARC